MIHIAAATQIRLDTEGRAYYRRKLAAGKTRMEAMRCLKRRISDAIYRQLVADAQRLTGTGPESTAGRLRQSSAVDLPRTSTLRISHFLDSHPRRYRPSRPMRTPLRLGSPANAPTRRSRQRGAPHWTNDLMGR